MAKTFASFDAEDELNFWKQHNQIIVSSDALKPLTVRDGWSQKRVDEYNKYRLEAVLEAEFDMVIIDEAHKMGGATAQVSRYVMADALFLHEVHLMIRQYNNETLLRLKTCNPYSNMLR